MSLLSYFQIPCFNGDPTQEPSQLPDAGIHEIEVVLSDLYANEIHADLEVYYVDGPGCKIVERVKIHFKTIGDMGNKLLDEVRHVLWLDKYFTYDVSELKQEDIKIV